MTISKIEQGRARFAASVLPQRGEIFAARRAASDPTNHQSGASSPTSAEGAGTTRTNGASSMASLAEAVWSRRKGGQ